MATLSEHTERFVIGAMFLSIMLSLWAFFTNAKAGLWAVLALGILYGIGVLVQRAYPEPEVDND